MGIGTVLATKKWCQIICYNFNWSATNMSWTTVHRKDKQHWLADQLIRSSQSTFMIGIHLSSMFCLSSHQLDSSARVMGPLVKSSYNGRAYVSSVIDTDTL